MTDRLLGDQAAQLTDLLPRLLRAIFTFDANDPTMDLPVAQLRVCSILCDGRRTISTLAGEMSISVSAVTQIADRLESAGIVERLSGTRDRRTRNLRLTARGSELLRIRRDRRVRRAGDVLSELTPTERTRTLKTLQALLDASVAAAAEASDGRGRGGGDELEPSAVRLGI